jgi:hypothetical protein
MSSLPLQRSGKEFEQLLAWYVARDAILGENKSKLSLEQGIELASSCSHPDAVWWTKMFAGRNVKTRGEVCHVLLGRTECARSLCFSACFACPFDVGRMKKAATLGYAYAQARMAQFEEEGIFHNAEKAAAQGEREGFYWLGCTYQWGFELAMDLEEAKRNFLIAADLGHVNSLSSFALCLERRDPMRYVWLGKSAAKCGALLFLNEMVDVVKGFNEGKFDASLVFVIGEVVSKHVDLEKETIFGTKANFVRMNVAKQAIELFRAQSFACQKAVNTWSIIGKRLGVVKDVRLIIAKLIWGKRGECGYRIKLQQ